MNRERHIPRRASMPGRVEDSSLSTASTHSSTEVPQSHVFKSTSTKAGIFVEASNKPIPLSSRRSIPIFANLFQRRRKSIDHSNIYDDPPPAVLRKVRRCRTSSTELMEVQRAANAQE